MTGLKVLYVTAEMTPLAQTGGLGDVAGALPGHLRQSGADVRVIMPLYKRIKDRYGSQLAFRRWAMIKMGWRTMYSGLLGMDVGGVPTYFIDNDYYFGHDQIYVDYSFDIERFSFFQRAVLEALGQPMDFEPDILHCNDWQTGMIPCLLDAHFRGYGYHKNLRTVFTIHNLKYQGIHDRERIADLMDLPGRCMTENGILHNGAPNFMKAGIVYADHVTTVSPGYAEEIMTEHYGEGLHLILKSQIHKISGFLNGIDDKDYDPTADPAIPKNYGAGSWQAGKAACKASLQKELGLAEDPDVPLAVMVTRLVDQKGIDLLLRVLDDLLGSGLQLAVLGTGEKSYETALAGASARNEGRMAAAITYDNALARRFYAGADLFLMPSLYEPCGLSQMIAMRYGTLPVVRRTGGLRDTVQLFDPENDDGNGFGFEWINAHEFLFAVQRACDVYRRNPASWAKMVERAMLGDYSWDKTARQILALYRALVS